MAKDPASRKVSVPATPREFVWLLRHYQLLPDAEIAKLEQRDYSRWKDATEFAKWLIQREKLTKLQCQLILRGKAKSLRLESYVVVDQIGAGGMGEVYKAYHQKLKREVAIKVLPVQLISNEQAIRRFHREAQAAARLSHPNIVMTHDAGETRGIHYLVMEYVDGVELASLVKTTGPMPVDKAVGCVLQTAKGLEYAHREGVVHRDIKPHNLLLDPEGTVKILDMGLARIKQTAQADQSLTETGAILGTLDFMSPEQATDIKNADARSDIYSLGCTLFYLLGAKAMYPGGTHVQKLLAHREQPVPNLTEVCPTAPDSLNQIYHYMVAKNPTARYQSMTEVIEDLEKCQLVEANSTISDHVVDPGLRKFLQFQALGETVHHSLPFSPSQTEIPIAPSQNIITQEHSKTSKRTSNGLWLGSFIVGILLVVIATAIFISLPSPSGIVVLEIDDPNTIGATVTIDGEKPWLIEKVGQQTIEIQPDGKTHRLEVSKGGFQAFTQALSVKSGERKNISIRLIADIKTLEAIDPKIHRNAAILLLSSDKQHRVRIQQGKKKSYVLAEEDLPDEPFQVVGVKLNPLKYDAQTLRNLPPLPGFTSFNANYSQLTDNEVPLLLRHKDLTKLNLAGTAITDKGLLELSRLKKLTSLYVGEGQFSENALKKFSDALQACYLHSISAERVAATTLLIHQYANVGIVNSNEEKSLIKSIDDLPSTPFHIYEIDFQQSLSVPVWAHRVIRNLSKLDTIHGWYSNLSDEAILQWANLPSLRYVTPGANAPISDKAIKHLTQFHTISSLNLNYAECDDACLTEMARIPNLEYIGLWSAKISDV
ncbi:MAG: serine/threonine protein kinase, partial [Planctomycetaceae bacterium]|nr:serine/threonine protein kinase [Planctomycetaceae bacterium]